MIPGALGSNPPAGSSGGPSARRAAKRRPRHRSETPASSVSPRLPAKASPVQRAPPSRKVRPDRASLRWAGERVSTSRRLPAPGQPVHRARATSRELDSIGKIGHPRAETVLPRLSSHSADMPPSTRLHVFVAAIALLACAAARPLPVAAQTTTTIAGTVTDRSGAGAAGRGCHSAPRRNRPCADGGVGRRRKIHIRLPRRSAPGRSGLSCPGSSRSSEPTSSRRLASECSSISSWMSAG